MLIAATTTGDLIVGIVALLVGLAVIVGIVWLLWRLVTWPARARRRRRNTGGLGSDYEAMLRQQPRTSPATGERRAPFPPPGGWQSEPAVSQVVLPPPSYRPREPEAAEPEPATVTAESQTPKPSTWDRLRTPVRIPAWLTASLAWLGCVFVVFKPLGFTDWLAYGVALVFAVGLAVYIRARYHSRTLWRSGNNFVIWVRWGKDQSAPPPVVIEAGEAVGEQSAPLVLRDADKLDHLLQQRLITRDEYERLRASEADESPTAAP